MRMLVFKRSNECHTLPQIWRPILLGDDVSVFFSSYTKNNFLALLFTIFSSQQKWTYHLHNFTHISTCTSSLLYRHACLYLNPKSDSHVDLWTLKCGMLFCQKIHGDLDVTLPKWPFQMTVKSRKLTFFCSY